MNRSLLKNLVAQVAVGLLAVMLAGPAAAAESGSGVVTSGTWSDNAVELGSPSAPCGGKITDTAMNWSHTDTSTITVNNGATVYTGPSTVDLTSTANYWFDQQGSYEKAGCSNTANNPVGYDVPATASLSGNLSGATVSCASLSGTFDRTNVTVSTVTMTGSCTVTPSGGTAMSSSSTITWQLNVPLNPATLQPVITGGNYSQS